MKLKLAVESCELAPKKANASVSMVNEQCLSVLVGGFGFARDIL